MNPEDTVLVGVLNNERDFLIARDESWYRIPAERAPDGIHAQYLAFYQTKSFGDDAFAIHYYARINGVELLKRRDLLPSEADHPRAEQGYYKLAIGPLVRLPHAIISRKWRRVTFLVTSGERFQKAWEVNDLVLGAADEDVVWRAIRDYQVESDPTRTLKDRARLVVLVDQSIKVEQTNADTVIALANGVQSAICIPSEVKREVLALLRRRKKPAIRIYLLLFAAGVFLLIQDRVEQIGRLVIDNEYAGHEPEIRAMIHRWCYQSGARSVPDVTFGHIGKQSRAHTHAWQVKHGVRAADQTLSMHQLARLLHFDQR